MAESLDKHVLYEAAVQGVEVDLDLGERIFRRHRKRKPRTLREDFCGTALLCCHWVSRRPKNTAIGIDLDRPTLDWSEAHRRGALSLKRQKRMTLIEGDVMKVETEPADLLYALNFSYNIFHERATLRRYFKAAKEALNDEGIFILDVYGGPASMDVMEEERENEADVDFEGVPYPKFTYVWDQHTFNFIDNITQCYIHFRFKDGSEIKRAFGYHWRLWSLPELRDLLLEVGFSNVEVYLEGWDEEAEDSDGIFRRRTRYENMQAFIGYIAAIR